MRDAAFRRHAATVMPWRTSSSSLTSPLGELVCTLNTPWTPVIAARTLAGSAGSPCTSSTPASRSATAFGDAGLRTSARTGQPSANSAAATDPPCWPVAPNTKTDRFSSDIDTLVDDQELRTYTHAEPPEDGTFFTLRHRDVTLGEADTRTAL
jgi:hypothetical protein